MSRDQVSINKISNSSSSGRRVNIKGRRVDINDLLSRARDDEKKQKKENLVFFGVVASIIALTGIIASL